MKNIEKCDQGYTEKQLNNSNGHYCYACPDIYTENCFLRNKLIEPKSGCTRKYLSCTDCGLFVKGACLDADVED